MDGIPAAITDRDFKAGQPLMLRARWPIGIDRCTVELDGRKFSHFWIADCALVYRGGAVHLTDVLFVNCRMDCPPMTGHAFENQRKLLAALVSSNIVSMDMGE